MIRADGIDILVDLSGIRAEPPADFARKPAPIQVTYLGYPNTTGMKAIDYRFTDALADPPGMTDHLNAEKLWRLPGSPGVLGRRTMPRRSDRAKRVRSPSDVSTLFEDQSQTDGDMGQPAKRVPQSRLLSNPPAPAKPPHDND